jgi:long-chain acyl-CoA synthetase
MLTHRALIANHRQLDGIEPRIVGPNDIVLLALPLFHAFGLNSSLGAVAWHGACGVLVERYDPVESLSLIARHQVSVVAAVPQMYVGWSLLPDLGESLASVRVAVSGAAPLDPATGQRFMEATRHPVFQGYGLTETSPVLTTSLASPVPKSKSIGRPIPEVEIMLRASDGSEIARVDSSGLVASAVGDPDEDEFADEPGTDPGEIVVRGPNLFSGYWPDGSGGPDADGWWATGDVAYADTDGDLFLVDRLDELILVSGFNVYPHEVELVLAAYPGVAEAAVVGVEHPYTGRAVKAYVVLGEGVAASTDDLVAHCERSLARFKCPDVIEFVPQLPHSATGKVRKRMLGGDPLGGHA